MLSLMNNLFATWHSAAAVEIRLSGEPDAVELLSLAHERLGGIPELVGARRLVAAALEEVSAWTAEPDVPEPVVRSTSYAGNR
jgi:hypothetical protein